MGMASCTQVDGSQVMALYRTNTFANLVIITQNTDLCRLPAVPGTVFSIL